MRGCLTVIGAVVVIIVIVVVIAVGSGSSNSKKTYSVRVDAPAGKHWSGSIGNSTVDGVGSKTITYKDQVITAADAQKMTAGHWTLTMTLRKGSKVLDTGSTSAGYGLVTVSGSDF
jgi:hypothetical protein